MDSVAGDVESGEKVDREPRMHIMANLSNEKFSLHLSQYNVELYGLPCFSAMQERGQPLVHNSCNGAHASCG